jgi:hypothetical protein
MAKRTLDAADEIAQSLRVMQSVLVKNDAHIRKRDLKHKTKPKRAQQAEGGSIVDQVF